MKHNLNRRPNRNQPQRQHPDTIDVFRPAPKPRRIPQPSSLQPITLGRRTDPLDAWISELQHEGLELNLAAHFTA